ncbi:MAG: GPP34 family phosphoprotein [Chloroflexi bacterium]|nr:MAG: GPP34 family phosphoprotein [Chloroflexota bacterium]
MTASWNTQNLRMMDLMFLLLVNDAGKTTGNVSMFTLAAIADLTKQGRIEFDGLNLSVKTRQSVGHAATDEVLRIVRNKMPVNDLLNLPDGQVLKKQQASMVVRQLCHAQKKKVLLFFPVTVYPLINQAPKQALHHAIRTAIMGNDAVPEEIAALLAIMQGYEQSSLLPLRANELKTRQKRLKQLSELSPLTVSLETAARLLHQIIKELEEEAAYGG